MRARNGRQSSLLVGHAVDVDDRHAAAGGACSQNVGWSSSVPRCSEISAMRRRTLSSRAMRTLLLGECLVDLVCERPASSLADAPAFVPHFGGAVANVAVVAARRGADVALAGGAGDDAWGAWLRERLEAEGVDLRWFRLVDGVQTPLSTVIVDADAQPTFAIYGDSIGTRDRGALAGDRRRRRGVRRAVPRLQHARRRCRARAEHGRPRARARARTSL